MSSVNFFGIRQEVYVKTQMIKNLMEIQEWFLSNSCLEHSCINMLTDNTHSLTKLTATAGFTKTVFLETSIKKMVQWTTMMSITISGKKFMSKPK